jgi:hypothetical protein
MIVPLELLRDTEKRNEALKNFNTEQNTIINNNIKNLIKWIEEEMINKSKLSKLKSSENSDTDITVSYEKDYDNYCFYINITYYEGDVYEIPTHPNMQLEHISSEGSRFIDDSSVKLTLTYIINFGE